MMIVVVVAIAALGFALYLTVMFSSIPGAVDERLGKLEELPSDLGTWVVDRNSEAGQRALSAGKQREVRTLHEPGGLLKRPTLVVQGRLRDLQTGEILDVEPEQRQIRRRKKA
jgi:hypothetical protein